MIGWAWKALHILGIRGSLSWPFLVMLRTSQQVAVEVCVWWHRYAPLLCWFSQKESCKVWALHGGVARLGLRAQRGPLAVLSSGWPPQWRLIWTRPAQPSGWSRALATDSSFLPPSFDRLLRKLFATKSWLRLNLPFSREAMGPVLLQLCLFWSLSCLLFLFLLPSMLY